MAKDWLKWHLEYDTDPIRGRRLEVVRDAVADSLDHAAAGPIRAISMCAGDGRDLLGVLDHHARARDVSGRLVELDPTLADRARETISRIGLGGIVVETADAGSSDAYVGVVPADLVLVCGVFGNISDRDVRSTVQAMPMLCAPGATVIWTRHRRPPDLTPLIRRWLAEAGFDEVAFNPIPDGVASVGVHRFVGTGVGLIPRQRWFRFSA